MKRKIIIIGSIVAGLVVVAAVVVFAGVHLLWGRGMMGGWREAISMNARGGRWPFNQNNPDQLPGVPASNGQNGQTPDQNVPFGNGMGMQGRGGMGMNSWFGPQSLPGGDRISIDQALSKAQDTLSSYGKNIKIGEIMEFGNNFYVVVKETDSGRGAFELLVDPYSGRVSAEPGPNMMWNTKYNHMGVGGHTSQSEMSLDQAAQKARDYLKKVLPTADLQTDGTAFYGYSSFDYKVNGVVAGMLSVNSTSGDVWMHTWHGVFISEKSIP